MITEVPTNSAPHVMPKLGKPIVNEIDNGPKRMSPPTTSEKATRSAKFFVCMIRNTETKARTKISPKLKTLILL